MRLTPRQARSRFSAPQRLENEVDAVTRSRLTLKTGQPGTEGLLSRYGKRLVCVRYRYDEQTHQRVKTVELIENRTDWEAEDGS